MSTRPIPVRLAVVGTGTVGRWLLRAVGEHRDRLRDRHGVELRVVAVGARDGLVHRTGGVDLDAVLAAKARGESITRLEGVERWPDAVDALQALEVDVVAEVTQSPPSDGEPGLSHLRTALRRGIGAATSNKWPVALAGVELAALAREHGAGFRAESTVMSGTPVLSALTDGLGGARPVRLRGVLNATVNAICTRMAAGLGYREALAEAQAAGLAERDPSADVDGLDAVAKVMVLSALVFGEQLALGDVARSGLSALGEDAARSALADGRRLREVATLDPGGGRRAVEVTGVSDDDPLFRVDGPTNCVQLEAEPLGAVTIAGPGAGPALAGQGVFSDVIALAQRAARRQTG